jgi:sugar lactone lactonase YvrE
LISYSFISLYVAPSISPAVSYKTSWIGNTFGGGSKWVQNFIDGMYVASDGTVYTNSGWDEAGREVGIYKNGDVIGKASELHGWGRGGGVAVTANSKYLYVAMKQEHSGNAGEEYPPSGTTWYAVRRYNLSGVPAPFKGGRGYDKSMLIISKSGQVTGLANAGSELYVSDSTANRIRVFNTETMAELRSWSFARPLGITVDGLGNLWIIQAKEASNRAKILRYAKTGKLLPQQLTDAVDPTALAYSQSRILVADNGPRQQVLIYNITGKPRLTGTLGKQGGIYSGKRGEVGALKFYGLTGVGADAAGNIYVSLNGFNSSGTDLRKFSPNGALQWRLLGLEFVDGADADPSTDAVDVFTKHEHFVMDYTKGSGQEWTYKAYTLDKFRYPDDKRLHGDQTSFTSPFVRRIGGRRFLYLTNMWADSLSIYRFDGEIAVPSGIFAKKHLSWPANQPENARWMWRDQNGDGSIQSNEYENLGAEDDSIWGWEVDSKGDVWQASESGSIRRYRVQGLDAYGSPIYNSAAADSIPMPAPFQKLERLKYFPATDVMYLGGYTRQRPHTGSEWGIVGTEIVRYDKWSTTKNMRWRVALPYQTATEPIKIIKAMDVAGDRVFAVDSRTAVVYVYDAATGASVTTLKPGLEVKSESGMIDIPYGLRAYRRANGKYLVFVEEDAKAKIIMYRYPV